MVPSNKSYKIFIRLCSVVNSNFLGCSSNKSFINILFLLDNLIPFPDIFSIFILCSSKYFKSFLIVLSEQDNFSEKYLTGLKSLSSIKYSRSFFCLYCNSFISSSSYLVSGIIISFIIFFLNTKIFPQFLNIFSILKLPYLNIEIIKTLYINKFIYIDIKCFYHNIFIFIKY